MNLSEARVSAEVAVTDMGRAREFYEGKLGLKVSEETGDGGCTYRCGEGTELHIFPTVGAGQSESTVAGFTVDDLTATVGELSANGVSFEQYDEPTKTDERGIADFGSIKLAWTKDPDGNVLAIAGG
jgi:catechol 2,3-dioxygenase-like lactoylglutathione lyase family enzyme